MLETRTLTNASGCRLEISNYGATIIALNIPDKNGELVNVVVSLDDPNAYTTASYIHHNVYLGCTVGRCAGRISNIKKHVLLKDSDLTFNEGVHLHGGMHGFDKKYWTFESSKTPNTISLSYISKHLEEGYPGNLKVIVNYTLTVDNELLIYYTATTDATTYVNLTNHTYFNLQGYGNILDHHLQITSDYYLDVDSNLIPTGKIIPTINSKYDRTTVSQIERPGFEGYDDTFILKEELKKASLYAPSSGIKMEVQTNQPAMVIYTPKAFPDLDFKDKVTYTAYPAICFENQHFPDAPNNSHFPSILLQPNQEYEHRSSFKFSIKN